MHGYWIINEHHSEGRRHFRVPWKLLQAGGSEWTPPNEMNIGGALIHLFIYSIHLGCAKVLTNNVR